MSKGKKAKPGKKKGAAKSSKAAKPSKNAHAAAAPEPTKEVVEAAEGEAPEEAESQAAAESSDAAAEGEATPIEEGQTAGDEAPATESAETLAAEGAATGEAGDPADDDAPIEPAGPATPVGELARGDQKRLVESLVFVSDRAISAQQLGRMLKIKMAVAKELVDELIIEYQGRGIELVELSGGYQFRSAPTSAHVVREHIAQPPVRLTRAQLETLALVAYRQPITRPEIDDVRGVDSGSALRVLLERGLLKMLGRKDEPGRPLLYGTAPFFLDFFGMRSLKDLPTLREFTELSDENRALFKRKTGETIEEAEAALLAAEEAAQRDSLAPPSDDTDDVEPRPSSEEPSEEPPANEAEESVPDRDLEVQAATFAAGSLQTSPDSSTDEEHDSSDEEPEPSPAPEA